MSATQGRYRIGVDVGGTFTDAAVFDDAAGSLRYAKVPSTPADPARAVLDVLESLGVDLAEVQRFIHGITIGTNAVLEGRGAEVWMLTTAGFRDVLEIARTNRTVLYDITALKPPPLVPRGRTLEIDERMAWDGSVLRPLDLDQARAAVQSLPPGVAVAVCFLHSAASIVQTGFVEGDLHCVDAAFLIHADDVTLTLFEKLCGVIGLLENVSVLVELLPDVKEHCFQFGECLVSGPLCGCFPVGLHQPALLDVPQVRTPEGLADLYLHGIIADPGGWRTIPQGVRDAWTDAGSPAGIRR